MSSVKTVPGNERLGISPVCESHLRPAVAVVVAAVARLALTGLLVMVVGDALHLMPVLPNPSLPRPEPLTIPPTSSVSGTVTIRICAMRVPSGIVPAMLSLALIMA